ncbi:outer membrane protein assembly factor BamE [Paraurantiacibacter namhicola]|uniref:Outer membrane protein assembly factor BamE n=1 Tax=Paraurantiacibacter namhicola TaxID=645517 RepID=A0A1C7D6R7_9SPHN|nr:outer membrane protein assembly factor BamE [Paraurantiacibacter namhicola]ANU07186.1 Outer membrane protein assembly factor BamE [Paraurantiacibacter namhicola]
MNKRMKLGLVCAAATLAAGCTSIADHRGYIVDEALLQAVSPGLDNKRSVEATLGQPSFKSQFGPETWYYVSSKTGQKPFGSPEIERHTVLAVAFDAQGNVTSTDRNGMEDLAQIDPEGDITPTLGRERGLIEDLFGNIGRVGGIGPAGGGGQ